ncbi:MAG: ABC transporter permease [Planctomycetota bacterium]
MNRFWRTFKLGVRSLGLHPLRSFLTILGIMFGVSSVIAMLAIGEGASYEAQEQIKALGSTNIIIKSIKPLDNRQAGEGNQQSLEYGIKYQDAELVRTTLPNVKVMVRSRDYPQEVQYENRLIRGNIRGTVPWFPEVSGTKMKTGSFFGHIHEEQRHNVCVLTPDVARKIFLHEYPVGKILKIGLEPFTVLGVIEQKVGFKREKSGTSDVNLNTIYIPISTSRSVFGEEIINRTSGSFSREKVELHELQVQVDDTDDVLPVAASIKRIMKKNHETEDYEVVVPLELLQRARETARIFNIVLGSIAGISLLVGGIGIMNIMLASVTERTREIGIRRALGAQRRHIVLQFLVETIVLSSLGGAIGIGVGLLLPTIVTRFSDQTTIVRPMSLILSFGISALVGMVFGIYPAQRASKMDPIEALRHE